MPGFGGGGFGAGLLGMGGMGQGVQGAMGGMGGGMSPFEQYMMMQQMMGGMQGGGMGQQQQQGPQTLGQIPPMHQGSPGRDIPMIPVRGIPQGGPLMPFMGRR